MDGWVLCLETTTTTTTRSNCWHRIQKVTKLEKVKGRSERVNLTMTTMILKNQFEGVVRVF